MIIKKIVLHNIRSYIDQEIEFKDGVSLLAGDIGTGKSTILLAIDFALFGLQRGELSGEALLRNGAGYGVVSLEFSIGENEYKIQRALKKSGSGEDSSVVQDSGFVSVNGDLVKGTAIELKQKIVSILNYPAESFSKKSLIYRYTVYTPQEEMKAILFGDAESRLETLRKLFDVDKYKRIIDNSRIVAVKLREKKKELAGKIYDFDEKKNKLAGIDIRLTELNPVLTNAEYDFKNFKELFEIKKEKISAVEEKVKRLNELRKNKEICSYELNSRNDFLLRVKDEIDILKNDLGNNNIDFDVNESADALIERSRAIENNLKLKEEELQGFRKKIIENENDKKNHSHFLDRLRSEFAAVKNELNNYGEIIVEDLNLISSKIKNFDSQLRLKEEELQSSRRIIVENETRKKHQEHLNSSIISLENCPTCKQEVSVEHKISIQKESLAAISKFDDNIFKAKEFENGIVISIDNIKSEIEKLKALLKENELKSARKKEFDVRKIKHDKLSIELENAEKKMQDLLMFKIDFDEAGFISEINLCREKLKEAEIKKAQKQEFEKKKIKFNNLLSDLDSCERKLIELSDSRFKIDSEINCLIDTEKEFLVVRDELEGIRKQMQENELKIISLKKDIEFAGKEISVLREEILVKEGIKLKLDEYGRIYSFLDSEFASMVEMMERKVMLRVHSEFNSLFSKWLNLLLNSEITSAVLDSSFTPVITQNGYDIDYSNLSGGEKTACALAYRLALNQVVNSIDSSLNTKDLIILDEPTDGFSPEQLEILKDVLGQLDISQVIIVSHEPKIESFADHVIKVEKNEHISRVNYI